MRKNVRKIMVSVLVFGCTAVLSATANNATEELFNLLDKGGCDPASLVAKNWTITTYPGDAHGELILGDVLRFELSGIPTGVNKMSALQITRNGEVWQSENGWSGQCISDGTITQYVVSGDIDIAGCLHDMAIGRLDHDDNLSDKVEVIFEDSTAAKEGSCEGHGLRHPDHAHGDHG